MITPPPPLPSFKKIKTETDYNFKRIENNRSFHFNVNILDNIQQSTHVGNNDTESAHNSLSSIRDKLKKTNKLVRIAGKSETGWLTIEENQNDSAASDSNTA